MYAAMAGETPATNLSGRHDIEVRTVAGGFCLVVVAALVGTSCALPQRSFRPEREEASLDDVSFLHYLATLPVVTVDEGMRAVLLLTDDNVKRADFDDRFDELRRRGAVKTQWRLSSGRILDKGTLAYMLRAIYGGPRSVNELVASRTGLGDRRYALKACVARGLMPYGLAHEPVTGGELLSALTELECQMASRTLDLP